MRNKLFALALAAAISAGLAFAGPDEDQDDIVRLPGQGQVKPDARAYKGKPERLVPGGGLMVSFDADQNGRITQLELLNGVEAAFLLADANEDGTLSALEQIAWANDLPTHDDTLSNPARFDPNLDRMVSYDEFVTVISSLAADYAGESGDILVSDLKAPERPKERRANFRPDPEDTLRRN